MAVTLPGGAWLHAQHRSAGQSLPGHADAVRPGEGRRRPRVTLAVGAVPNQPAGKLVDLLRGSEVRGGLSGAACIRKPCHCDCRAQTGAHSAVSRPGSMRRGAARATIA